MISLCRPHKTVLANLHSQSSVFYIRSRAPDRVSNRGLVVSRYADPEPLSTRLCGECDLDEVALLSVHDHMAVFHPNERGSSKLVT